MTAPPPLRWGVLGATSWVARDAVLPALAASPTARIVAVASRDGARARDIAGGLGLPRAYGDYTSLLEDEEVEAVYLPLPNALHATWTLRSAQAGRHVLCEKPLGVSAPDVASMHTACAAAGVHLVEAYMTQFHPRHRLAVEVARSGTLGELRSMHAVFTFPLQDSANHRWRADAGGGALLDVGVYCLAPMLDIAGREPVAVTARRTAGGDGVDATTWATLDFGGGLVATVECSFEQPERQWLEVTGNDGVLVVDRPFTCGPDDVEATVRRPDGTVERLTATGVNPYQAMLEAFWGLVREVPGAGPVRGVAQTVAVARTVDRIAAAALDGVPR